MRFQRNLKPSIHKNHQVNKFLWYIQLLRVEVLETPLESLIHPKLKVLESLKHQEFSRIWGLEDSWHNAVPVYRKHEQPALIGCSHDEILPIEWLQISDVDLFKLLYKKIWLCQDIRCENHTIQGVVVSWTS